MSEMIYCTKCGAEIRESDIFCPKCGSEKVNDVQKTIEEKPSLTRSQIIGNKFSIIMGIVIILSSAYVSNPYNLLMGIALLVVGFVSLKTKSKSVNQFMTIISCIIFAIAIINLIKLSS